MQIYLARNNVQAGPYTLEQLNTMLASGEVILDDLMWHEGMENWQRVGTMTQESHVYQPNVTTPTQPPAQNSVERLYPRAHQPTNNTLNLTKTSTSTQLPVQTNEIASVWSRILAVLIDQILALLCLVPILSALNFDIVTLSENIKNPATINELITTIPSHLSIMTSLMFLALFIIQVIMLIKRGQSIGKLATGVRILDYQKNQIPNITNLILIRTILTNLAYNLSYVGQFIAIADLLVMIFDKQHRSIHDRFAKTYVVKAHPTQLEMSQVTVN